jgi:hypothetical protein
MRTYWLEVALITVVFICAMAVPLVQAQDETTIVTDGSTTAAVTNGTTVLQEGNLTIGTGPDGSSIVVRPLDAPGNPYANAYSDLDRWAFQNIPHAALQQGLLTDPNAGGIQSVTTAGTPRTVRVMIDRDGFIVPQNDTRVLANDPDMLPWEAQQQIRADAINEKLYGKTETEVEAEAQATQRGDVSGSEVRSQLLPGSPRIEIDENGDYRYVYVTAPMDDELAIRIEAERMAAYARAIPPVPTWLRDVPRENVLFLPNGEVAVEPPASGGVWMRYDAAGNVVATSQPGQSWRSLFAKNYDTIVEDAQAQGLDIVEKDGFIVLRDKSSRKVVASYDFDGTPVPIDQMATPRPFYFTPMRWSNLEQVAAAQTQVPMGGRQREAGTGEDATAKP